MIFLTPERVRQLLIEAGAVQQGHFRLTSGRHSDTYIDKDSVSASTRITELFCGALAGQFHDYSFEVVVGPAYGAIVAAHVVAQQINRGRNPMDHVIPVFAVKEDGKLRIRKSMARFVRDRRCLIVEDILTTGRSARETIAATISADAASIVGVGAFCNRGKVTKVDLGLPDEAGFSVLLELEGIQTFDPAECPMCQQQIEISREFGHGPVAA